MRRIIFIAGLAFVISVLVLWLLRKDQASPYADVIFIEDSGGNSRHVLYKPVLKSNPSIQVGSVTGADYGRIHFEDIDGDGVKETIIETQLPLIDTGEFYGDTKTVLRCGIDSTGRPKLEVISEEVRGQREW